MINRLIPWSIAMMFNLSLSLPISTGVFSKLTQVQRRAKYCHLSNPRHRTRTSGAKRECPGNAAGALEEQSFRDFISGLNKGAVKKVFFVAVGAIFFTTPSWVIAKRESWAEPARGAKRRSSARSANARATPGWQASYIIYEWTGIVSTPFDFSCSCKGVFSSIIVSHLNPNDDK